MNDDPARQLDDVPRGISLELPCRFGDYELEEEIARGAMGVVFKARQLSLDRPVAIKLVLASWLASEEQAQRFQTEARASAGFQHPSIVPVYEIGVHEGQHYLCLAFIDGQPLSDRVEDGAIAPTDAARVTKEIASAIQYAHEQGVLHRDIKPSNVLLDERGHTWVTDFGLAKVLDDDSQVTATGESVGTPSYMSPEQAAGEVIGVGPATDVYGIGATLFALLTGRPPFIAPTAIATLRLVQDREPIPPRTLDPSIPKDLETICMRCMRKSPHQRYASAAEVMQDLERFLTGAPIHARPVGTLERLGRRIVRYPVISGLVAALILVALVSIVAVLTQWRQTVNALDAKRESERVRIESQIDALGSATPEAFAVLSTQLDLQDPAVMERLEAIDRDASVPARLRFRVQLAMLPARPAALPEVVVRLVDLAQDPHEYRLAVESLQSALAGVDAEHRAATVEGLEALVLEDASSPEQRRMAAVALVVCARESEVWQLEAEPIAEWLAETDPFFLPVFAEPMRPFPRELVSELGACFLRSDERTRLACASLLAACGSHEPEILADLLPLAEVREHATLLDALHDSPHVVADRMREFLARPKPLAPASSHEPPPDDERLQARFHDAHGILGAGFAICLDMPLETFKGTCEDLRPFGYRPTKIRPTGNGSRVDVAAVFTRDRRDWQIVWDVEDPERSGTPGASDPELTPIDLASFVTVSDAGPVDRDVLLMSEAESNLKQWSLHPGQSAGELVATADELMGRGFGPVSLQITHDGGGALKADSVWHLTPVPAEHELPLGLDADALAAYKAAELCQLEVDATRMNAGSEVCSGIWAPDGRFESRLVWEANFEGHDAATGNLLDAGFAPIATSVAWGEDGAPARVASVWQRPLVPVEERTESTRRRARAAATLAGLGEMTEVVRLLRTAPDPSLRFALAFDLAELSVDRSILERALGRQTDAGIRFALLLALGQARPEELAAADRASWIEQVELLAHDDPDPGIHSLCLWILGRLHSGLSVEAAPPPPGARWRTIAEQHTLVRIEGPVEFVMGSPGWVPGRASSETPRLYQLERPFEIGTAEVSSAQMRRFLHERPEWDRGIGRRNASLPVEGVSWFEAIAYCRWLSEAEGLPEEQMCYPPLDQIGPDMVLEQDHLEREGYRLPTEAEWEYACRAGARTLHAFGADSTLLHHFANAPGPAEVDDPGQGARPVAQRLPNGFGLFDMHGNVQEWCHDRLHYYRVLGPFFVPTTRDDREDLAQSPQRVIRGGWYESPALNVSCAGRRRARAETASRGLGFRIARTAPKR